MSLSPLDRDFLDELLDGDREFGGELLQAFSDSTDHWLAQASQACATGDVPQAVRAFHTLKGSAASVGLIAVRSLARDLELLSKEQRLSLCGPQLPELRSRVQTGRRLLAEFLETM